MNMNNLELFVQDGKVLADSRKVAEMIGKDHAHLCRDIAGYIDTLTESKIGFGDGNNPKLDSSSGNTPNLGASDFFIPATYKQAGNGKAVKCYKLTKQGCEMVANKLTGKKGILFTATYVQQFNKQYLCEGADGKQFMVDEDGKSFPVKQSKPRYLKGV